VAVRALNVFAGREAARRLSQEGWQADHFSLLLGASGGPKWFILSRLDQVLFSEFLASGEQPLTTLGSSIGSWRHACLPQADPAAAIRRLEAGYLYQEYETDRPTPEEISKVSGGILDSVLDGGGIEAVTSHPRYRSHIVTARGRGVAAARSTPLLATGMGIAALGNTVSRGLLKHSFQRVVFHSGDDHSPGLSLDDFHTAYVPLGNANLRQALHASGSIPFVLTGERDIPGAPPGQYWDGGIIDYHFDLGQYRGDGLILYPHFRSDITPGWFDKFLPWRRAAIDEQAMLVLMCPSPEFVATLPQAKIPDRGDFTRLSPEDRVSYWETCVERSQALADEFLALIAGPDPLAGVTVLD